MEVAVHIWEARAGVLVSSRIDHITAVAGEPVQLRAGQYLQGRLSNAQ